MLSRKCGCAQSSATTWVSSGNPAVQGQGFVGHSTPLPAPPGPLALANGHAPRGCCTPGIPRRSPVAPIPPRTGSPCFPRIRQESSPADPGGIPAYSPQRSADPISPKRAILVPSLALAQRLARQFQGLRAKVVADPEVICIQRVKQRTHVGDHAFLLCFQQ